MGCPWLPALLRDHGCGSLPSETDGNLHTQLPRRLAHSGAVRGSFNTRPSFSATYVAWGSGSTLPLGTVIMQMTATVSVERATMIQRHMASFKEGTACPLNAFQKMLGLLAAASPVLQLGLFHMQPIQFWLKQRVPSVAWRHGRHRVTVTRACVSGLLWLKQGMILDTVHRRKVVTTDASNKGLANRPLVFGLKRSQVCTSTA